MTTNTKTGNKLSALPKAIATLIKAQNEHDSSAFTSLFTTDAIVHDEGRQHNGTTEIKQWNETTHEKYHATLEPLDFLNAEKESVLTVMVSGNFDGSPIPLNYHITFEGEKIKTMRIAG